MLIETVQVKHPKTGKPMLVNKCDAHKYEPCKGGKKAAKKGKSKGD